MAMGKEQTLTVDRILSIYQAIQSIEGNTKLDFTVSYRLGRLSDACKSIVKVVEKNEMAKRKAVTEKVNELRKNFDSKTPGEKEEINAEIKKLSEQFTEEVQALNEQEETIKIPEFKLKDFEGKDIPVKFFALMGDIIPE
jgi:seryl-tRNA synthetase